MQFPGLSFKSNLIGYSTVPKLSTYLFSSGTVMEYSFVLFDVSMGTNRGEFTSGNEGYTTKTPLPRCSGLLPRFTYLTVLNTRM